MTVEARSCTGTSRSKPPKPPTGVRRGSQMTASRTEGLLAVVSRRSTGPQDSAGPRVGGSEGAGVALGLGGQLGVQCLGRPVLLQRPPDQLGLGLGGQATDRLGAVQVGRERVALRRGCYDVAQRSLRGAGGQRQLPN